jgi:hypothetical protein
MLDISIAVELIGVIFVTVGSFLFSISPWKQYDLQFVAILFIIYFVLKQTLFSKRAFYYLEVLIFMAIILSTVFATGMVASPFFFLLYFLLFALALLFDSSSTLVLSLLLMLIFIMPAEYKLNLKNLLPVFSLPFIAPLAKYLGDLQKRFAQQKQELKRLNRAIEKVEGTKEYEKVQTLIFLTTVLHKHMEDVQSRLDNFMGDRDLEYLKEKNKHLEELVANFMEYVEKI